MPANHDASAVTISHPLDGRPSNRGRTALTCYCQPTRAARPCLSCAFLLREYRTCPQSTPMSLKRWPPGNSPEVFMQMKLSPRTPGVLVKSIRARILDITGHRRPSILPRQNNGSNSPGPSGDAICQLSWMGAMLSEIQAHICTKFKPRLLPPSTGVTRECHLSPSGEIQVDAQEVPIYHSSCVFVFTPIWSRGAGWPHSAALKEPHRLAPTFTKEARSSISPW